MKIFKCKYLCRGVSKGSRIWSTEICETNLETNSLPSTKVDPSKLAHLSDTQCQELLSVIDKYPECFSDTPGCCDAVEHEIIVTPDFWPKRMKAYWVPEKLRPEVDKQIQELQELGFIQESKSLYIQSVP